MALEVLSQPEAQVPVTDAQSAINNLLTKKANYLASQNPAEQAQERKSALEQYQEVLKQPAQGNFSPEQAQLYGQIGNIGRMPWQAALGAGIAAGGRQQAENEANRVKGNQLSAKVGYEDLVKREGEGTRELQAIKGMIPKTPQGGGWVTKMDKDGNMVAYNPLTNEKRIVHSSQGEAYQRAWTTLYNRAVEEGMPDPEKYAHSAAIAMLGRAPNAATSTAPASTEAPAPVPGVPGVAPTEPTAAPRVPAPTTGITYKDKAEEARKKENATKMEGSYIKDYEDAKNEAVQAGELANTVGIIKQIPRTQDAFAPWREKLGAAMNAVGLDGKMVNEAENIQQVRPMINSVVNKILNLAKGPQTDQDAKRAYGQFMQISDTQKAADFMYTLTEEMAKRAKFKRGVYEASNEESGTMKNGNKYWESSDMAKTIPVGILNGKAWGYSDWRDKFMKANPDATSKDIIETWNSLTRK